MRLCFADMRLAPLASLTPEELDAWRRLAATATESNPFFEPTLVLAAAEELGAAGVQLLVWEADGEWAGCVPVRVRRFLGRPVALSSWKHDYSFLGTPLVARDRVDEYAAALIECLGVREHGRFLTIQEASDGPVLAAIRRAIDGSTAVDVVFERSHERASLQRRPEPDYLSGMKSRRRSELKRQRRKLGEELDEELSFREWEDNERAVAAFLELEASSWKGEQGTAMASNGGSAAFFRSMCAQLDQEGRLRLCSLTAGERPVAMICDIVAGDTLFGFKSAFDEGLKRYAPGILLQVDNFTAFHERGSEQLIDSCGEADNETLNKLWPDRRPITTIVIGPGGTLGRLAGRALEARHSERTRELAGRLRRVRSDPKGALRRRGSSAAPKPGA